MNWGARALCLLLAALLSAGCTAMAPPTPTSPPKPPPTSVPAPTPTSAPAATPAQAAAAKASLPTRTVTLRRADGTTRPLTVEVADTDASRAQGLMFRPSMPEDAGMLFVFPGDFQGGFWMMNTLIPLSIAFIAADGRIVHITDMQPQTTETHQPPVPYRYALEVNQGFFARAGIKPGDRVEIGS